MRLPILFFLGTLLVVLLVTWKTSQLYQVTLRLIPQYAASLNPKCNVSKVCPSDHFEFYVSSGIANIVGPKICVDGKIVMSHVRNNVGQGLNVVLVNGESGVVEKSTVFQIGSKEKIIPFLKEIVPGTIVLMASYDDVAAVLTDDVREAFAGMGSFLITSLKYRDNWVFAGRAGTENKIFFESHAFNNKETNLYDEWPQMVELDSCFPKTKIKEEENESPTP